MEYNDTEVLPITELIMPSNTETLELYNSALASQEFKWGAPARPVAQSYDITFYTDNTTSEDIFRIPVTTGGNSAIVSHSKLIQAAELAGIQPGTTGKLFWSIISNRGENSTNATLRNEINVVLAQGINDVPSNLYLGGVAENNEGKFRTMRNLGDGRFEIIAEVLSTENFFFSSRNIEDKSRCFYAVESGEKTSLVEGTEGQSITLSDGVYMLSVDFNLASVQAKELSDVVVRGAETSPMTYVGGGEYIWEGNSGSMVIPCDDQGRYRFDGVLDGQNIMIGSGSMYGQAAPATFNSAFEVFIYDFQWGVDRYNFTIPEAFRTQSALMLELNLSGDIYNHTLDYPAAEIMPITALNNPTELDNTEATAFEIESAVEGANYTFSWTAAPSEFTTTYTIRFYTAIGGTDTEIHSATVKGETNYSLSLSKLGEMVAASLAGSGEVVKFTWSVEGEVFDQTTAYDGVEEFFVKTKSMETPTALFLTGGGSEFGTVLGNAGTMRAISPGVFEIYAELSASGSYGFASSRTGTPNRFGLIDGKLAATVNQIDVEADGIFRVTANFVSMEVSVEKIEEVKLFWNGNNNANTLEYIGNGAWRASKVDGNLVDNTGRDAERYRFNAQVSGVREAWGYHRWDNWAPEVHHFLSADDSNDGKAPQLVYVQKNMGDDWSHTFKTDRNGSDNQRIIKLELFMNGTASTPESHYHVTLEWYGEDKPESSTHVTVL